MKNRTEFVMWLLDSVEEEHHCLSCDDEPSGSRAYSTLSERKTRRSAKATKFLKELGFQIEKLTITAVMDKKKKFLSFGPGCSNRCSGPLAFVAELEIVSKQKVTNLNEDQRQRVEERKKEIKRLRKRKHV